MPQTYTPVAGLRKKIDATSGAILDIVDQNGDSLGLVSVAGTQSAVTTIVLAGDSRHKNGVSSLGFNAVGYMPVMNNLCGGRFLITTCTAVVGVGTDHLLSTQLPAILALPLSQRKVIDLDIGYNSTTAGQTAAKTFADVATFVAAVVAVGSKVVLNTSLYGSTLTASTLPVQKSYNQLIRTQGAALTGVIGVFDGCAVLTDPATGSYLSPYFINESGNYLHVTPEGAMQLAMKKKPLYDQLFPPFSFFTWDVNNSKQLVPNPAMNGNNASGSNGWSLTAGNGTTTANTGNGPDNWTGRKVLGDAGQSTSINSAASGVFSKTARSDGLMGTAAQCVFTAGLDYEGVAFQSVTFGLKSWSSGLAVALIDRVVPTVTNGCHYRVVTAGSLATGSDPTAGWSTVLGTQFTSGSATLEVVESIGPGDTVMAMATIEATGSNGAPTMNVNFLNSGSVSVGQTNANYFNSGSGGVPATVPAIQTIMTPATVVPATTAQFSIKVFWFSLASGSATFKVTRVELVKVS